MKHVYPRFHLNLFIVSVLISCLPILAPTMDVHCEETASAQSAAKGFYRMKLGDFEIIALSDGSNMRLVEQQLSLLNGNTAEIKDVLMRAYPTNQIPASVNAFLINTGAKLILVDAGNGKTGNPAMGKVLQNLREAGYQPENVDEIYLTHMHPDHVGGLVLDDTPLFVNATVYANKAEAEYWLSINNLNTAPAEAKRSYQIAQKAITPYLKAGKFKTFENGAQLAAGIRAEALTGHTPGHTAYFVESRNNVLVLWGDIIHVAAVQFAIPSVTISFDSNQREAKETREQILREASDKDWLIGGAHLLFPGLGHVVANPQDGYTFIPLYFPATAVTPLE